MRSTWRGWSWSLLAIGVLGCVLYLALSMSGPIGGAWYLATAALGTGMSVAGALWAAPERRRVWVALAAGQVLYLLGDVYWTYAEHVLKVVPYPSLGDAGYLLHYVATVVGLCWLVRSRQAGRDRAAFLDAAILTSAFALPAVLFLIVPAVADSQASLLSNVVAAAYPIGDVLVLAVLLRMALTPAANNVAFLSIAGALVILLGTDVYYTVLAASGGLLPRWANVAYALTFLFLGFAAMHPSSSDLTARGPARANRPVATKVVVLGCALLLAPALLATLALTNSSLDPLLVAIGGAISSILVLVRLSDLLGESQSQSMQLAEMARTDALTGLPNRRTWDHELARASDAARAEGASLTVVMLDMDDFNGYNEARGHLAGDLALKETAAAWASVLAGHGFLARYGGEEFAALFPDTEPAAVQALLQRLHATVASGQTCSIGVAIQRPDEPAVDAMNRADQALYEAKGTGRNRTSWHDVENQMGHTHPQPLTTPPRSSPRSPANQLV